MVASSGASGLQCSWVVLEATTVSVSQSSCSGEGASRGKSLRVNLGEGPGSELGVSTVGGEGVSPGVSLGDPTGVVRPFLSDGDCQLSNGSQMLSNRWGGTWLLITQDIGNRSSA